MQYQLSYRTFIVNQSIYQDYEIPISEQPIFETSSLPSLSLLDNESSPAQYLDHGLMFYPGLQSFNELSGMRQSIDYPGTITWNLASLLDPPATEGDTLQYRDHLEAKHSFEEMEDHLP